MIVYEPQIASWANQKQLVAFAAASYEAKGAAATAKPALGTLKIEAETSVSLEQRLVSFANLRITEAELLDAAQRATARTDRRDHESDSR